MPAPPDSLRTLVGRYDPAVFDARARIRLEVGEAAWDAVLEAGTARLDEPQERPAALLSADAQTWEEVAGDVRGGLEAFRRRRLNVRHNLHVGVGFLAATSGLEGPGRLEFRRARTRVGTLSYLQAGVGDPVVMLHGLGATKMSLLPTVGALGAGFRCISLDLPGFGDSVKPIGARYDARYFAGAVVALLDALGIERAHLVGNSLGGRVALEVGLREPDRVGRLGLLAPSMAWRRERRWAPALRLLRPELGLLQLAPERAVDPIVRRLIPGGRDGWAAAGVDEFLRSYRTARGRAAFYAAARQIYLEEPEGDDGFWPRLRTLEPDALFVWGRHDQLVPIAFARHVSEAVPGARHKELDCGHVPQLERPRETHAALTEFLGS
jgi:pimeloyl-ACP methyl ester carboxylesterase